MVYHVIGLMSGSSLDGLDIAYAHLTEISGKWSYDLEQAECLPYPDDLRQTLKNAAQLPVPDFVKLHTAYGHYIGEQVNEFIQKYQLQHKVHFIASHGHTVWHEPAAKTSVQIGDGAAIATQTLLPAIVDLRNMDVALGGQGAPIVPIADKLLFSDFDFCLNLGGIANITINQESPVAFDICPANQLLDHFANKMQTAYDAQGQMARKGTLNEQVLNKAAGLGYYETATPKSLDNGFVHEQVLPCFTEIDNELDALHTSTQHIAQQIAKAVSPYLAAGKTYKMLVTGGGALNTFLLEHLQEALSGLGTIQLAVPDEMLINFKEALAMALIGALRWREEPNVLMSVTGASKNSVGGALWLPPID